MAPPVPRVQRNLQTLGVLWCVYAGYRVLQGFLGMFFLRAFSMHGFAGNGWPFRGSVPPMFPMWLGAMVPLVGVITVLAAGLALLVGFSLLNRKPWGRTLAIVVAILSLIKFPTGTALGIYTLWVLAPRDSGMEYEAIADRS
jgi:type IV secretory pathway VirB2 component (pilin)